MEVVMFCVNCGKPLEAGDVFCTNCGARTVGDAGDAPQDTGTADDVKIAATEAVEAYDAPVILLESEAAIHKSMPAPQSEAATAGSVPLQLAEKKRRKKRWPFVVAGLAALLVVAVLAVVFVLKPFGEGGFLDFSGIPGLSQDEEAEEIPIEEAPREYSDAESFFTDKLALLTQYGEDEDYPAYFALADSLENSIMQVLESEENDDAYTAEIIALSQEYLEKLDSSNIENSFDVLSVLNEAGEYEAMSRFFGSAMIDEDNRDEMVDMMFHAFAETGDFSRAERVIRELLVPFTGEALSKTLEYRQILVDDYPDWEASWEKLSDTEYDRAMLFENGTAKVANNVGSDENKLYKWGIIDANGDEMVALQYDTIGGFLEGRAAVQSAGLWGFIDENGEVVIDLQYEDLKDVQDPVLYAYAVRDPERVLRGFYEGFAPVKKNGKWGYIDSYGNPLGPGFAYQDIWYFSEGYATVEIDGKYGLLNSSGRYIIEPNTYGYDGINYDVVRPIYEGLAGVNWDNRKSRGVINRDGRLVAWFDPETIDLVQDYREGLASVRKHINGVPKWGFIDRYGEIAIPIQYDSVSVFIDGTARVSVGGKLGLIDGNGGTVLPIVYEEIGDFYDDIAYVRKDNKIGFVRRNGEILCDLLYDSVTNFSEGLACVCFRGKWGVIDSNGNTVLSPVFEGMKSYSGGVAPAKMNGKWGYVDASGYFVVPPQFEKANVFSEGFAAVSDGDKYYYIMLKEVSNNLDGEVVDEGGEPVKAASVKVYRADDLRMRDALFSTATDDDGNFKIVLPEGLFKIVVSKDGCVNGVSYEEIGAETNGYATQIIMVKSPRAAQTGRAEINVGDALTGVGVGAAEVRFRRGFNNKTGVRVRAKDGEILQTTTDRSGNFTVNLPYGIYTAEVSSSGYTTIYINFPVGEETANRRIMSRAMTESLPPGETRITLEWGEYPQDLDSHLMGPVSGEYGSFHVYYPVKGERIEDSMLDKDDTEGNGFETTTIYEQHDGVYRYSVFDYTNQDDYDSNKMSHSGARVSVYRGDACVAVFDIPAGRRGNLWEVFRIEGDKITAINNVTAHHDLSFYVY
ncbi:MAG: WG repeat-containing protein [Clostridiales Family XIII bacterium]|jgi:hypothetical protein|nr:WG repeat-containing protein [Clostridiales Family XIII bacterium]